MKPFLTGKLNRNYGISPPNYIDVVGQKFGRLTVIENRIGKGLRCRCDCGKECIRTTCGNCHLTKKRPWKAEELEVIRESAGKLTSEQIAERLGNGRTAVSVKHKARSLGLSLRQYGENCSWSKYSNHDCELARSLHEEGMSVDSICEKLEIPHHAMHSILYFKRRT